MFKNQVKVCLLGMAVLSFSACTKEDEEVVVKKVSETTQTDNKSA